MPPGMNPSYYVGWTLFRLMYATYFRWRVYHPERVPLTGPVILASNHLSFLDPPLVGSGVRLTSAVATFNALRVTLEVTAAQIATEAGLSTEDAVEAIERVLRLADIVLEGMAEVYERAAPVLPAGAAER